MNCMRCSRFVLRAVVAVAFFWCVPNLHAWDPCSDATFKGAYAFTVTGTFVGLGPIASVGRVYADGLRYAVMRFIFFPHITRLCRGSAGRFGARFTWHLKRIQEGGV